MGKVRVDVEGKSVISDPPLHADSYRGDLLIPDPHPGKPIDPVRGDAERCQDLDKGGLEASDEKVDVGFLEQDNRIPHELAGTVVRDVATTGDPLQRDPFPCKRLFRHKEIRLVPRTAQGVNVGMCEKEERVTNFVGGTCLHVTKLDMKCFPVPYLSQPNCVHKSHRIQLSLNEAIIN